MATSRCATLLDLPPELLDSILSYLNPHDLTRFGQTCKLATAFIRPSNQLLWKASFLQAFDNPKHSWDALFPTARAAITSRESAWDWFRELHRRYTASNALRQKGNANALKKLKPEQVILTLLDILETASSHLVTEHDPAGSRNLDFLDELLRTAPRLESIVHDYHRDVASMSLSLGLMADTDRPLTRSMLALGTHVPEWASRFHIFYGMTERECESTRSMAAARALVYDWGMTGPGGDYGPFSKHNTGAINWQLLEAVASLMNRIFKTALETYHITPSGFRKSIPNLVPLNPSYPEDWAGVNGVWLGTYAFLDYRALVHYNVANTFEYSMDLGNYEEACGDLMRLRLKISDEQELQNDSRLQTGLPYCDDLPILYFKGQSNGRRGHPAIQVRGFTCLIPGGRQVRWRFIIRYAGADQWQLEGVQPGGVRSGGVYGLWSHVDHDEHGPVGPFFYGPAAVCNSTSSSY